MEGKAAYVSSNTLTHFEFFIMSTLHNKSVDSESIPTPVAVVLSQGYFASQRTCAMSGDMFGCYN